MMRRSGVGGRAAFSNDYGVQCGVINSDAWSPCLTSEFSHSVFRQPSEAEVGGVQVFELRCSRVAGMYKYPSFSIHRELIGERRFAPSKPFRKYLDYVAILYKYGKSQSRKHESPWTAYIFDVDLWVDVFSTVNNSSFLGLSSGLKGQRYPHQAAVLFVSQNSLNERREAKARVLNDPVAFPVLCTFREGTVEARVIKRLTNHLSRPFEFATFTNPHGL